MATLPPVSSIFRRSEVASALSSLHRAATDMTSGHGSAECPDGVWRLSGQRDGAVG